MIPDPSITNPTWVSVVLPVYKNADTLQELHTRLKNVLDLNQNTYQMIYVNDACPAGSMGVLEDLARIDPNVMIVSLERNIGQHAAVLQGLVHAQGRWMVIMDADLQDPPEMIPALLQKSAEGFDAVFAGRRGQYESQTRLLTSRLFKKTLQWLTNVPADAGMFVVITQEMKQAVLNMHRRNPFVVAMIGCAGLPIVSIPVERSQRSRGESAYSSWGRLKAGLRAITWVMEWKIQLLIGKIKGDRDVQK